MPQGQVDLYQLLLPPPPSIRRLDRRDRQNMRMFESSDVVPVSGEKDKKGTTRSLFRVTEYSFDTAKSVSTVQAFRVSSTQVFPVGRTLHCVVIWAQFSKRVMGISDGFRYT